MPTSSATTTPRKRRQPADRMPKKTAEEPRRAHITVTIDGHTYTSKEPLTKYVTFGVMRKYGHDEGMMAVKIIEAAFLDQPDALDALDALDQDAFAEIGADLFATYEREQGLTVGEASRSVT